MKLIEQKGNLFELDQKYALVHCISLDCAMGQGIAIEFDKRFKDMKNTLIKKIKSNNLKHPITIIHNSDNFQIFNLITKEKYWYKPTYKTITECIKQMAYLCDKYQIKNLAMPKIGCGLDKLQWDKVKLIIEQEFKDLDIEIIIRYL